jgi:hypothetical protein
MSASDIVIIGAPRSGTNMLRDILTSRPGLVTWPCDEINGIWRHGSRDHPTDEIPVNRADRAQQEFIRGRFDRVRQRQHGEIVVEKTCANSLRVDYVAALLPTARYVLITRDGIDATASAMARWHAPLDLGYTARKARFVPASDLVRTAVRFGRDQMSRGSPPTGRAVTWGPRFAGIDEMVRTCTLDEVCATQWQRCVERSLAALDQLPAEQVFRMTYEQFVHQPAEGLLELLRFLRLPTNNPEPAVAHVSAASVGAGRSALSPDELARVQHILSPTLERLSHV